MRQRVMQIKEICAREELRVPTIADIISENGEYVSERTLYTLLKDGSENMNFQHHTVITVYEALITRFGEMADVQEIETLKRLLVERDKQIDRIVMQAERREEDYENREKIYADRKKIYDTTISMLQEQIDYLKSQIALKDKELHTKNDTIQRFINLMMKE